MTMRFENIVRLYICGDGYDANERAEVIIDAHKKKLKSYEKKLKSYKEKAEKYRWHDLRKNPDDLPNIDGNYEVYGRWSSGKPAQEIGVEFKVEDGYFRTAWNFDPIAWRVTDFFEE